MRIKKLMIVLTLTILLLLMTAAYHSCFHFAQFYYDDTVNIFNTYVAQTKFSVTNITQALKCTVGGHRPLSYLTFYLNYLACADNANGYFIINFFIHCLTTIGIYILIKNYLHSTNIALFTVALWALSPVNFFSTAYIVQRMTQLMTLFGIISLIFLKYYIEKQRFKYWIISFFFVILSILSKENGILFLPLILFPFIKKERIIKHLKYLIPSTIIFFLISTSIVFNSGYKYIGITPFQRLLTESRVFFFYLETLLLPTKDKLYLYVNIIPSNSIISPISTLYSSIAILIILLLITCLYRKNKTTSVLILLFFYFQILEATTIPLRIIFFHRMYLPSIFLFSFLSYYIDKYIKHKSYKFIFVISLVLFFFFNTLNLSSIWVSKSLYLKENLRVFPNHGDLLSANAYQEEKIGNIRNALELSKKAHKLNPYNQGLTCNIIIYMTNLGLLDDALSFSKQITITSKIKGLLARIYFLKNQNEKALLLYEEALRETQDFKITLSYLHFLEKNEMFNKIIAFTKAHPYQNKFQNNKIKLYQINALIKTSQVSEAKQQLLSIPNCFEKNILEVKLNIKIKEYQKALSLLNELNTNQYKINEKLTITLLKLKCYLILEQRGKAIEFLDKAIIENPLLSDILSKQKANIIKK